MIGAAVNRRSEPGVVRWQDRKLISGWFIRCGSAMADDLTLSEFAGFTYLLCCIAASGLALIIGSTHLLLYLSGRRIDSPEDLYGCDGPRRFWACFIAAMLSLMIVIAATQDNEPMNNPEEYQPHTLRMAGAFLIAFGSGALTLAVCRLVAALKRRRPVA